jgi:isomerase DpgB
MSDGVALVPALSRHIDLVLEGQALLAESLVQDLEKACDAADAAAQDVLLTIRLRGGTDAGAGRLWPGPLAALEFGLVNRWELALRRLERLNAVTLTAVEGCCSGVALEVLLATDYRMFTPSVRIALRGSLGGIWPGMAMFRLARELGIARSRQLALWAADLSAERALDVGLIDEIVDNVDDARRQFSDAMKRQTHADVALRRRLLLDATDVTFEDALGAHLAACERLRRGSPQVSAPQDRGS